MLREMSYFDQVDFWEATQSQDGKQVKAERTLDDIAEKVLLHNLEQHQLIAKSLSDLCLKPKPGEQWRIATEKSFNAFAFILHLLESEVIEQLHLAIYRINQPTVKQLIDLIDAGQIQNATFVISNFFNQTKKPELWAKWLCDYAEAHPRCKHVYLHNHSKVVCAKTASGFYVFEGSGNMSDNARIEQYLYENNEQAYNFHVKWMTSVIK